MKGKKHALAAAAVAAAIVAAIAAAAICLAMAACSADLSEWYPSGAASIAASRGFAEDGQSGCDFTIKVANVGTSMIGAYTVSISATTSDHTYYATFNDELTILPGCHAYFDGSIRFDEEAETLITDGLAIVCDYYR
jgi:hypothetical protein